MRPNRPLAVLTALAVGSAGLLVVGLGSFLDVSKAHAPVAGSVAVTDTVIRGQVVDPDGRPADNYEVQAVPVSGRNPAASAISYGGRFALFVPAGNYRIVGVDLTSPTRLAPLELARTVRVSDGEVRRLGSVELRWRAPQATRAPRITGTARVGAVLRADTGVWDRAGLSFDVVWLRGPVEVGRGLTYRLGYGDAGAELRARVTATAPSTAPANSTSPPVTAPPVRLSALGKRVGRQVVVKVKAKGVERLAVRIWRKQEPVATRTIGARASFRLRGRSEGLTVGPVDGTRADRVRVQLR